MALNYDYASHYEDRPIHKISVYTEKDVDIFTIEKIYPKIIGIYPDRV